MESATTTNNYSSTIPPNSTNIKLIITTSETIQQVKDLLRVAFPINISDKFYSAIARGEDGNVGVELRDLTNHGLIGCICYRQQESHTLYINAFAIDVRMRQQGYGSYLLQHLLTNIVQNPIKYVTLHVQTSNETAIEFYKKFGFVPTLVVERYYPRLQPSSAALLTWTSSSVI
jgi:ribosomal protein S18 acetylase RimI-like enzyme